MAANLALKPTPICDLAAIFIYHLLCMNPLTANFNVTERALAIPLDTLAWRKAAPPLYMGTYYSD